MNNPTVTVGFDVFRGNYENVTEEAMPVSPLDGYKYSRLELTTYTISTCDKCGGISYLTFGIRGTPKRDDSL